jgi:hypothetical protein
MANVSEGLEWYREELRRRALDRQTATLVKLTWGPRGTDCRECPARRRDRVQLGRIASTVRASDEVKTSKWRNEVGRAAARVGRGPVDPANLSLGEKGCRATHKNSHRRWLWFALVGRRTRERRRRLSFRGGTTAPMELERRLTLYSQLATASAGGAARSCARVVASRPGTLFRSCPHEAKCGASDG